MDSQHYKKSWILPRMAPSSIVDGQHLPHFFVRIWLRARCAQWFRWSGNIQKLVTNTEKTLQHLPFDFATKAYIFVKIWSTCATKKVGRNHKLVANTQKTLQLLVCDFATKLVQTCYKFKSPMQHWKNEERNLGVPSSIADRSRHRWSWI